MIIINCFFKLKVLIIIINFFILIVIFKMFILLNLIRFIIFSLFLMCIDILVLRDNLSFLIVVGFLILYSILLIVMVLLIFYWAFLFLIIIIATFNRLTYWFLFPIVIRNKFLVNFWILIVFLLFVLILIDWIRRSELFWCILILKITSKRKVIRLFVFLVWNSLWLLFHPFLTKILFNILILIRLKF